MCLIASEHTAGWVNQLPSVLWGWNPNSVLPGRRGERDPQACGAEPVGTTLKEGEKMECHIPLSQGLYKLLCVFKKIKIFKIICKVTTTPDEKK